MRILHVIPSLSRTEGGPSFALPLMAEALQQEGCEVDVATTDDGGHGNHIKVALGERLVRAGVGYYYFSRQSQFYKVSLPLARWLKANIGKYDLVHIHALFSFSSCAAARAAHQLRVPYIIRPLGVLNRWGMTHRRRWIKHWSFRLVEQPILNRAAVVHYTSEQEKIEAEAAGVKAKGAVIPLGIDVSAFTDLPDPEQFLTRFPKANGRPLILFLSRLDQKKGLDLLLPAFAQVRESHPESLLVLAGAGHADYLQSLRMDAQRLNLSDSIIWTGFIDLEEKRGAFAAATIFTLPSYSENFGIAAAEALAAGLPCVLTEGVAISRQVAESGAGLVIEANVQALAAAINQLLNQPVLREQIGCKARRVAAEHFSLKAMGKSLASLYTGCVEIGR